MRGEDILLLERDGERYRVRFHWGVSRGRDTYGYAICTAYVDGAMVGRCNGGNYDMRGVALSGWLETMVRPEDTFYGLSWHDPGWRVPAEVIEHEKAGLTIGLERYQAFYAASSPTRTEHHTIPQIDGMCGLTSVLKHMGFDYYWMT